MTQTQLAFATPGRRLQVIVTTQAAGDSAPELCLGRFATPFGTVIALGAGGALWRLGFVGTMTEDEVRADLLARPPHTRVIDAPATLAPAIAALLAGAGEITVNLTGTAFQLQVWQALVEVPAGQVISYAALAERIGRPRAVRAVGTAVGQNPASWAVPCHRVTRTGGAIGGYHWGEAVKRALLTHEGASFPPGAIAAM